MSKSLLLTKISKHNLQEFIELAEKDVLFRRALSQWALAELTLASQGDPKFFSHPFHREAYGMEQFILLPSDGETDTFSRLTRAAEVAAILRASGSSISDPDHKGDLEENQKRDQHLLLSAWGITGNQRRTEFYEAYNEILRTVATENLWKDIINPPAQPKEQKTIYFNIDAILGGQNPVAGEKAAKSIDMILEKQREDKNIRLVLVCTLKPGGRTNLDLLTQFNLRMFQGYGIWPPNLSILDLLSLNNAPSLVDSYSGQLRLSTLQAHATQNKFSNIELWTHAPDKIQKDTVKEIRIVDFYALGKLIEEKLKKVLFFSIQA